MDEEGGEWDEAVFETLCANVVLVRALPPQSPPPFKTQRLTSFSIACGCIKVTHGNSLIHPGLTAALTPNVCQRFGV